MNTDFLKKVVEIGLKEEVDRLFEIHKLQMITDLDRRKGEVVAGIIVSVMKMADFRTCDNRIIFTIRTDDKND